MRADRLLRMMMILQTRGKKHARDLAAELEVSERTIYRDVTALSTAGVPVYTEKGPGGGICLLEEYRTSLTGLSEDEAAALFMLNVPAAIGALGLGKEIKTAWLKLSSSLPSYLQEAEAGVRQRIKIDLDWWQQDREGFPDLLQKLYRAVWEDRVVQLVVQYAFGYQSKHLVEVYSLVAQGQRWFMVCKVGGNLKVFLLSDVQSAEIRDESFERDEDYDLDHYWHEYERELAAVRNSYRVEMKIRETVFEHLSQSISGKIVEIRDIKDEDWIRVTACFDYLEKARRELLPYGGAVEVVQPIALRITIADYARQILANHEHPENA